MADLFSEPFTGMNCDVVQFVRRLKIWALQARKSDTYEVMMVRLGRPWLMDMRVRQDWHRGELELFTNKPHGQKVKCDMKTGQLLYFPDGRLEEEEQDEVEEISYEESFSSR